MDSRCREAERPCPFGLEVRKCEGRSLAMQVKPPSTAGKGAKITRHPPRHLRPSAALCLIRVLAASRIILTPLSLWWAVNNLDK
jgi:hypothetical protein